MSYARSPARKPRRTAEDPDIAGEDRPGLPAPSSLEPSATASLPSARLLPRSVTSRGRRLLRCRTAGSGRETTGLLESSCGLCIRVMVGRGCHLFRSARGYALASIRYCPRSSRWIGHRFLQVVHFQGSAPLEAACRPGGRARDVSRPGRRAVPWTARVWREQDSNWSSAGMRPRNGSRRARGRMPVTSGAAAADSDPRRGSTR